MTALEIKKAMLDRGLTAAAIARSINAHRPHISCAIAGGLKTPWIRRGIAAQLGLTYAEVWSEEDPGVDVLVNRRGRGEVCTGVHIAPVTHDAVNAQ